jgi:Family of unknown function (DUF6519)
MKGDLTHRTFEPRKHYDRVLQQQGRVTLDADLNEQADLITYRLQSTAADVIGPSGAPMRNAGFAITNPASLTPAQLVALTQLGLAPAVNGDLMIGAGHYYVDGILVENDQLVPYSKQPYLPGLSTNQADGDYIAFLDVWKRHITALEDSAIRETALGVPDTATRSQVVWQVKLHELGAGEAGANCDTFVGSFNNVTAPSAGTMSARAQPSGASTVCVLAPTAGYRRLENQLYRVEIHDASNPAAVSFVWSRENGSIVVSGQFVNNLDDHLSMFQPGRDALRGFASGDWVELTTDATELTFTPGILVRLKTVEGSEVTLDMPTATAPIHAANFPAGAKVRRWDSPGPILLSSANPAVDDGYLQLEDGVQVKFTGTSFYNGDYWEIPARTALGDILWPRVQQGVNLVPLSLPPQGIHHHFSRLAMVHFQGNAVTSIQDCRKLFPPLTELTSLFYVCGDGQEATPNVSIPAARVPLLHPLQAGVANGTRPVAKALVEFRVTTGNGLVNGAQRIVVATDDSGVASCSWSVDSTTTMQEVEARLIGGNNQTYHLPVRYEASLDTAARVSYDPKACSNLAGLFTVQDALDRLCKLGHGGCCTTVGDGGEYPTIEGALKDLAGEQHICICLLAGNHLIERTINFKARVPGTVIHIRGCGGSTHVLGQKGVDIVFQGSKDGSLDEVHLDEFGMLLQGGILLFQSVGEVACTQFRYATSVSIAMRLTDVAEPTLDNCAIHNDTQGIALLFENVGTARMWHSQVTGLFERERPLVIVDRAQEVSFEHNTVDGSIPRAADPTPEFNKAEQRFVADFGALRHDELVSFSAAWAKSIPTATAARRRYAGLLTAASADNANKLTSTERYYYNALGSLIAKTSPTGAALLLFLKGLRLAALAEGNICTLACAGISARLELTGNQVDGITVLYGPNPALVAKNMFEQAAKNNPKFGTEWPVRDAVIQANDFGLVTVDRGYWDVVANDKDIPPSDTFRSLAFTNNRVHGSAQIFVAGYLAFTGNFFYVEPGFNGGALGRCASFAGNQSQVGSNDISFLESAAVENQTIGYLRDANQILIRPI